MLVPGGPVPKLDPRKGVYLWQVSPDGTIVIAPENQPGFGVGPLTPRGRAVKHGDLNPAPGGMSRGVNRAGGEFVPVFDENGNPTGSWVMNNKSSNTFARKDKTVSNHDNLRAAKRLFHEAGMDMSDVHLQDYNDNWVMGD